MKKSQTQNHIDIFFWFAIALGILLIVFGSFACSDDSSDTKTEDKAECRESIETLDKCLDGQFIEAMGLSVTEAIDKCDPSDATDKCVIRCLSEKDDCDLFLDCAENCMY